MRNWRPLIILGAVVVLELVKRRAAQMMGPFTLQGFADTLRPIAEKVQAETGILAGYGITQAAHESRFGNSELSSPGARLKILPVDAVGAAHNLFGFTAEVGTYWRTRNNPYVLMPTKEWDKATKTYITVQRPFRAYSSWEESYRDWARLMQTTHYTGVLKALKTGPVEAVAQGLLDARYATDPKYKVAYLKMAGHLGVA